MFVTFEGPEGAGKSTALHSVADVLRDRGHSVRTTRQPGDSSIGSDVRRLLLEGKAIEAETELFLYLADRAQHVTEVIRPALESGQLVLCDRFADSTIVYQGHARGLDLELLRRLNAMATREIRPDLTLLFDLDPAVGLARLRSPDRLDREPLEFHQKVRMGFLDEAKREPARWELVDASLAAETVARQALALVLQRLA